MDSIKQFCCINFEWINTPDLGSTLQIATDIDFEDIILDTSLVENSFYFPGQLIPNTQYYWSVKSYDQIEITSFITQDIVAFYEGTYIAEAAIICSPSTCDSSYQTAERNLGVNPLFGVPNLRKASKIGYTTIARSRGTGKIDTVQLTHGMLNDPFA